MYTTMRIGIPLRLLSVLFVLFLGLTACGSDSDSTKGQGSSEKPTGEASAEPREPVDTYHDFVAAVEGDDLASFTAMLSPGFAGLEAEGVGSCEYGEQDADAVFACLSAAAESGELELAPEPQWFMSIRDGLGQEFSGSELDDQVTEFLDTLSGGDGVGTELEENDVRWAVVPKALQDGSDLLVLLVQVDDEWLIFLIEQG